MPSRRPRADDPADGRGTSRLDKLIAHHEHVLDALRTTRALLQGQAQESAQRRGSSVLTQALALDADRRQGQPSSRAGAKGRVHRQRQRSAAFLATFDPVQPRKGPIGKGAKGMGSLIRRGYLVKKGDGYIRTSKVYEV